MYTSQDINTFFNKLNSIFETWVNFKQIVSFSEGKSRLNIYF